MGPILVMLVLALGAAQNLPVTPPNDGRPTNSFQVQGVLYNVTYLLNATTIDVAIVVGPRLRVLATKELSCFLGANQRLGGIWHP